MADMEPKSPLRIAAEPPSTADGRALIAESQAMLETVFPPEGIFSLTAEEMAAEAAVFLVARDAEGAALGCVGLVTGEDAEGTFGEVKRLFLRPAARGQGAGRALMQAFEAEARARGLTFARIETGPELPEAVGLYRRLGYRDTGPFGDYAPHPASLFMAKRLIRTGGCLCGQVRYRVDGLLLWQRHCHCESCRRATSAPITTYFAVADGGWRWTGAAPATHASSPGVERTFCATCGSPLAYRHADLTEMHFHAVTLDDPGDVQPEGHDFWAEHLPWLDLADRLPR